MQVDSAIDRLDEIIPYISRDECVLFIGAGLSKIAGCYDWNSVVKEMINHEIIKERIGLMNIQESRFPNEMLIDFCQQELSSNGKENEFWGIARKATTKDPHKFLDQYLPLVKKLREITPFPDIITTNIDSCLEDAGIVDLSRIFYEPNDFQPNNLNEGSIFHIHGYVEKFKDSLLTRRKYLKRYKENTFQRFLRKIFLDYSVLFVGYSLRDRDITNVILGAPKSKKHFALVSSEDGFSPSDITVFLDMYNIDIIVYGSINEFPSLLSEWINKNFMNETELSREQ